MASGHHTGYFCVLQFHDYDSGQSFYRPKKTDFLKDVLPEKSTFFVNARTFTSISNGYVTWKIVVASVQAQTEEEWIQVWKRVQNVLKIGHVGDDERARFPSGEGDLDKWNARSADGVKTGSLEEIKAAMRLVEV